MGKVLIVEDSPSMRQMLIFTLNSQNIFIDEAENGALGVEACKRNRYDVIITDINMPTMDGVSLL